MRSDTFMSVWDAIEGNADQALDMQLRSILMMALQGCALLLHLSSWLDASLLARSNALLRNGIGWLMMILLASASIGKAIQRHDARRRRRREAY